LNARQFFDVWRHVVHEVGRSRDFPGDAKSHRRAVEFFAAQRHGESVGVAAATYYDRLLSDVQKGGPR
jgi:hypothetical protein